MKKITIALLALLLATAAISTVSEASQPISSAEADRLEKTYGLDKPPADQSFLLSHLFSGDFGFTFGDRSGSFSSLQTVFEDSHSTGKILRQWTVRSAYPIFLAFLLTLFLSAHHVDS